MGVKDAASAGGGDAGGGGPGGGSGGPGRRAVFFDRDGTLNVPPAAGGYILDEADLKLEPGAADAVRLLGDAGYFLVLTTNQRCVAIGALSVAGLDAIHARLQKQLLLHAGRALDAIYSSIEDRGSPRRKPAPGMLLEAAAEHDIDLAHSWMIGDSVRDVGAALAAGVRPILIDRPQSAQDGGDLSDADRARTLVVRSILDAARTIFAEDEATI